MRLFIALELGKHIQNDLEVALESLREIGDVKWVTPENLHITLKFLGDVAETQVPRVVEMTKALLAAHAPFPISCEGIGWFGSSSQLRTLWVGVKQGNEHIAGLMKQFNQALDWVNKETFPPRVHITIGRPRSGESREQLLDKIEEFQGVKFGETVINNVYLKQSILGRDGPTYSTVETFPLEEP